MSVDSKKYDFLKKTNSVEEYVPPDYYNKLLKPYVFSGKTDLDIFREYLENLNEIHNVLELCSGSGRVTDVTIKTLPNANLILSDLSQRMLNYTKEKFKRSNIVDYLQGDAVEVASKLDGQYDLIYTLWGFSHSVHQHIHKSGIEKTKKILRASLEKMFKNNLRQGGSFYLVHFDSMSDEQRILMRQWQRVYPAFSDISTQTPSKQMIDEILHDLDNRNVITLVEKHLVGDPIIYEDENTLLEIFLNFHLETYFNNLDCLPTVIDDIRDCIKQYKNLDGTYSIGTGCYIYEVKKR